MITIVGNVLKDVYLNLDSRTEKFETDKHGTKWLDLAFNASEHQFFSRNSSFGGAAISMEVLGNLGIQSTITNSDLQFTDDGIVSNKPAASYRYLLIADEGISYLTPTTHAITEFTPPTESYDYLYIDRSAHIDSTSSSKISAHLDISVGTKLVIYLQNFDNPHLTKLIPRASLVFYENPSRSDTNTSTNNRDESEETQALPSNLTDALDPSKTIYISESELSYQGITERVSAHRIRSLA